MTLFLIVLVAIFLASLWVFLRSSPKRTRKKALTIYNIGTLITAVILCTLFTLRIYTNMAGGPDRTWWPVLSLIAGGIYIDGAGREAAKSISLHREGVRIGTAKDLKVAACFFTLMFIIAAWVIVFALLSLAGRMGSV